MDGRHRRGRSRRKVQGHSLSWENSASELPRVRHNASAHHDAVLVAHHALVVSVRIAVQDAVGFAPAVNPSVDITVCGTVVSTYRRAVYTTDVFTDADGFVQSDKSSLRCTYFFAVSVAFFCTDGSGIINDNY